MEHCAAERSHRWGGAEDDEAVDLAFNKKRADDRKDWINGYNGENVDHSLSAVGYADFVNKELVTFARYDTMRSIPCVVDGFKPTQRKVSLVSGHKTTKLVLDVICSLRLLFFQVH